MAYRTWQRHPLFIPNHTPLAIGYMLFFWTNDASRGKRR